MKIGRPFGTFLKVGDVVTSRFCGEFEIVSVESATRILCRSLTTGFEIFKQASHIKAGSIKDPLYPHILGVGFFGVGDHSTITSRVIYQRWRNMLVRCYDQNYQLKNPTYIGCTVCDEWHNFQNFAKWHEENYPKDGGRYEIDKDIRIDGNRVYSPLACKFVSRIENNEKASCTKRALTSPKGVVVYFTNISEFCRENNLQQGHISSVMLGVRNHHKGWTRV